MKIESARFTSAANEWIEAVFDGVGRSIPVDPENKYYKQILANGVQVAAYVEAGTKRDVNLERDRRIATFQFGGHVFQYGVQRSGPIASVCSSALGAIMNGAAPGDYRWSNAERDFVWYDIDNVAVKMDAQTAWDFAKSADIWMQGHAVAARALKDMQPIPPPAEIAKHPIWPTA